MGTNQTKGFGMNANEYNRQIEMRARQYATMIAQPVALMTIADAMAYCPAAQLPAYMIGWTTNGQPAAMAAIITPAQWAPGRNMN